MSVFRTCLTDIILSLHLKNKNLGSFYVVDLTIGEITTVVVIAVLVSIGTAGVPGVGLIMLAMVLSSVQLPVEELI